MLAITAIAAPLGIHVRDHLSPRGFDLAGSGSAKARELISRASGTDPGNSVLALVHLDARLARECARTPGVNIASKRQSACSQKGASKNGNLRLAVPLLVAAPGVVDEQTEPILLAPNACKERLDPPSIVWSQRTATADRHASRRPPLSPRASCRGEVPKAPRARCDR